VPELAERAWFLACLTFGKLLRAGRYSQVRMADRNGVVEVRKRRSFYAPLLVWLSRPLVRILDTGVNVLRQQEWEERERHLYQTLYGVSVRVDTDGTLVLPRLVGATLAALLEDLSLGSTARHRAVELAVVALADFHARGFTHGDAMAENVMVDLGGGVARWFDFETVHDPSRPMAWRRADDVRALLATCLLRAPNEHFAEVFGLVLDGYADAEVVELVRASFASVFRRPLPFHLGQAGVSYQRFRDIGRMLGVARSRSLLRAT